MITRTLTGMILLCVGAFAACSPDYEQKQMKAPPAACGDATHGDCDGNPRNGCETWVTHLPNCGACGRDCLGGSCLYGVCQPVQVSASSGASPQVRLAVDDQFIFYIDRRNQTLRRITKDGATAATVFTHPSLYGDVTTIAGLKFTSHGLFVWSNWNGGGLWHIDPAFGPVRYGYAPRDLAVFGDWLYTITGSEVRRQPLRGGPSEHIASVNEGVGVEADASGIYWVEQGSIYSDRSVGRVMRARLDGTNVTTIAQGLAKPTSFAMDETNLYVALNGVSVGVAFFQKQGGASGALGGSNLEGPRQLAVDAKSVYFVDSGVGLGSSIWRYDKGTKATERVMSGGTSSIALDGDSIYYVRGEGELMRVRKCPHCETAVPACHAGGCGCNERLRGSPCDAPGACGVGQYLTSTGCAPCSSTDEEACGTASSPEGCVRCPIGTFCNAGACTACSATDPTICGDAQSVRGCVYCQGTNPSCAGGICGDFTISGDAVLDNATGRVWQRMPPQSGQFAVGDFASGCAQGTQSAVAYCASLTFGGATGGRLPSVEELSALIRPASCPGCLSVDPTAFPTDGPQRLWTNQTGPRCSTCTEQGFFYVDFEFASIRWTQYKCSTLDGEAIQVRCVR